MSLVEEIKQCLEDDGPNPNWIDGYAGIELVAHEYQDSGRWFEYHEAVFKRDDEYVGVLYPQPATEYQEVDGEEAEVYAVVPKEVTITKYEKV